MRTERKALRRLALVAAASAALFMGSVPAYADNGPHVSTATTTAMTGVLITNAGQGRCASCHRAHTAEGAYLLNAADEESLCYSCHGGSGTGATTDVQNGVGYGTLTGALRGGGFQQARIASENATKEVYLYTYTDGRTAWRSKSQVLPAADVSEPTTSNHLGGVGIMWGNGALSATASVGKNMSATTATKLECTACHDPHGNKQYRILRPVPSDSGFTAKIGTNVEAGIFIKDTATKVYTTTNYWKAGDEAAVADTGTTTILGGTSTTDPTPVAKTITATVSSYQANVAAWCTTCHTRYLAPSGSYAKTSGDSVFTYRHTGDNVSGDATSNRNCIQCHVAHGTNAVMPNSTVNWPDGTPSSDSRLLRVDDRGVCVMCHNV